MGTQAGHTPPVEHEDMMPAPSVWTAFALAVVAMAALTGMDAVAKALSPDFPTMQIVFMRYLVPVALLVVAIAVTRSAWPRPALLLPAGIRAIFITLTAFFFFYAIATLPLVTATAIAMTGPVLTAIMGVVFLREAWNRSLSLAMALALAGALIIVAGSSDSPLRGQGDWSAWTAALLAPVTYSIVVILLRMHAVREGTMAIALGQAALVSLITAPFVLPGLVVPAGGQWLPVIGVGLLGTVGMLAMTRALRDLPASIFSFVDYVAPVWAALFGYVFFSEWPTPPVWIGTALIVLGCGFAATRQRSAQGAGTGPSG